MNEAQEDLFHNPFKGIDKDTIQAFKTYHEAHPKLYELFKKYAYQMKNSGRKYYGAQSIVERIRWDMNINHNSDEFKINNNFSSMYSRLLISDYPEFKDFFRTRKTRGQRRPYFDKPDLQRSL